jgi:hypothetical protein
MVFKLVSAGCSTWIWVFTRADFEWIAIKIGIANLEE